LLLYSYATHLRKGSYRSLPRSRPSATNTSTYAHDTALGDEDEEEIHDFYRVPSRSRNTANGSISSVADFVNVPGRPRTNGSRGGSRHGDARVRDEEEVLFEASSFPRVQSNVIPEELSVSERTGH
jgi:inositol phosphorylceramide synthase regulatory subunit